VGPRRTAILCGLALAVLRSGKDAHAERASVALRIECPKLHEDERAALEARARAELVSAPPPGGDVAIACGTGLARVTWRPFGRGSRQRTVALAATDGATRADELLAALHEILAEPPDSAPPTVEPTGDRVTPAAPQALLRDVREERATWRSGVIAGIDAELWQGAIGAAVGTHFGARLSRSKMWSTVVVGALSWGLGSGQGIRAWSFGGELGVDYAPVGFLRVGVGAKVRVLVADGSGLDVGPVFVEQGTQRLGTTAGALASIRYAVAMGPLALAAGPQLELLARPVVVEVAGSEVFRMPSLIACFSVDASTD
jgi:hypothetical protein